ncbi:hypothetical protein C8Q72DRAFT_499341 [Fomitopsis betulina]|nr:hypothetical protein C8Q72DRAFT_499341 [Fomitopsis betulina]
MRGDPRARPRAPTRTRRAHPNAAHAQHLLQTALTCSCGLPLLQCRGSRRGTQWRAQYIHADSLPSPRSEASVAATWPRLYRATVDRAASLVRRDTDANVGGGWAPSGASPASVHSLLQPDQLGKHRACSLVGPGASPYSRISDARTGEGWGAGASPSGYRPLGARAWGCPASPIGVLASYSRPRDVRFSEMERGQPGIIVRTCRFRASCRSLQRPAAVSDSLVALA